VFTEKAWFISLMSKFAFVLLTPVAAFLFAREELSAEVGKKTGKKVSVLNPQGKRPSIPLVPMAPRLGTLNRKTVYFVDVRFMNGDVLLKEMQKVFAERYPGVKTEFRWKRGQYTEDDRELWAEIKEKGGVMVMAIGH